MNAEGDSREPPEGKGRAGLTRRQTLGLAGAAGAALAVGGVVAGLSDGGDSEETVGEDVRSCLELTPEQTEGPFYVDLGRVRRDVTEGRPGVPLALRVRVVDPAACVSIEGAAVDIWHCDALGTYGDEASEGTEGEEFLRGIQITDASGHAAFRTIYPGHYEGRATHIHLKVHIDGKRSGDAFEGGHVAHTGQLFFPEPVSDRVYAQAPYDRDTAARVPNSSDGIFVQQGGASSMLRFKGTLAEGLSGSVALGVDPKSTPAGV